MQICTNFFESYPTQTRPAEKGKTTFAFVSINEGLTLGDWKEINIDFSRSENKEEKKKFEERILNRHYPKKCVILKIQLSNIYYFVRVLGLNFLSIEKHEQYSLNSILFNFN